MMLIFYISIKAKLVDKKYAGKIDHCNIDINYFDLCHDDDDSIMWSALVYWKSLKRIFKSVHKTNNCINFIFFTDVSKTYGDC